MNTRAKTLEGGGMGPMGYDASGIDKLAEGGAVAEKKKGDLGVRSGSRCSGWCNMDTRGSKGWNAFSRTLLWTVGNEMLF